MVIIITNNKTNFLHVVKMRMGGKNVNSCGLLRCDIMSLIAFVY